MLFDGRYRAFEAPPKSRFAQVLGW